MDSCYPLPNPPLFCTKCKQDLPASYFHKASKEARKYSHHCRDCKQDYERARSDDIKKRKAEQAKAWRLANPHQQAFNNQKANARKRGISFEFTLPEWIEWWGEDINNRGCRAGQYVMARLSDSGPYHSSNVFKCLATVNVSLSRAN